MERRSDARGAGAGTLALPPVAEKHPATMTRHGITRTDDYAWLRAENWQAVMHDPSLLAPEIRAHLEAENAYAERMFAPLAGLRTRLFDEMRARIKEDDSSVPFPDGPYSYGTRYVHGAEHPLYVRMARDASNERVLIDANAMAAGKAYFRLGGVGHSPDHRVIAYGVDEKGNEYFTLRFRDADSGADLPDTIPGTGGSAVWANDSRSLFYIWIDENHRPAKVMRHVLGTDTASDVEVYGEPDAGFFVSVGKTLSQKYVVIDSHDHETSEVRVIDADAPQGEPRLIAPRLTGQEYGIAHRGDVFYVLTNAGGAEDFKVATAPANDPGRDNWRDLIAHVPGRLILDFEVYRDHAVRLEREGGLPRIVVREIASGAEHAIAFDEEAYALGSMGGYEFDTRTMRFSYSSMTTPNRVYDYDMATRARVLLKEDEVPSGHNPEDYVTRRVMAPAPDGELVPVSLLYRKDTPLDGTAPLLLYGYGAYGISIPAAFGFTRLSLVDRGFVYAIAHVRGGKDKGYRWYAAGRRQYKVNTFTDFIAAARHLIAAKFTSAGRIVGWGGSAGGLLIGAVANMAPELFAGFIAEVPFVDTLNTMLDATLPLTPPEWPEWGNPIASADDYRLIASYSPYDNVRPQNYPPILALAGLSDPRVTYWEPAKWAAKLRATKTDQNPVILRTNMDAGHGGASGRFDRLQETAYATAFALAWVGTT